MNARGHDAVAGFTLIEMMIVITLMALSMLFLGPMLGRSTSARDLDDLGRRVALQARMARIQSMRGNLETALAFDPVTRSFLVLPGQDHLALPVDVSATLTTGRDLADGDRPTIRFLPDGRSSGGEIRLIARDASIHLVVDWLTGWVRRMPT
ncbi:prepilin-type N-terminal cleavage/methylation domain-containing protein [Lichenifustis flavocetrariae]|uniref:Prepilin-type N-terminal cleavage/methylation domain-containing protein n=1 Tax=Lichenifustis flavocetrariae TaxID=2949735 RepID=A0AA42CIT3_9HYPH|nr:GspH/FimT family pseudopilin [Lichenifustis flavocetrariae]MCW6508719.1 prepilin-type N-terminal cleavage/methylation domain-containing protein [Lichenifustis flavocetrariae]